MDVFSIVAIVCLVAVIAVQEVCLRKSYKREAMLRNMLWEVRNPTTVRFRNQMDEIDNEIVRSTACSFARTIMGDSPSKEAADD